MAKIILDFEDAMNLYSMIHEAIDRLCDGKGSDEAISVFGDKVISYERLIDKLDEV